MGRKRGADLVRRRLPRGRIDSQRPLVGWGIDSHDVEQGFGEPGKGHGLGFLSKVGSRGEALPRESNQATITHPGQEASRKEKKIAPSERKAQAIPALLAG